MSLTQAEELMQEAEASPIETFNLMRELSVISCYVKIPGMGETEAFAVNSAGRPGFSSWPRFWSLAVEVIMKPVVARWRAEGRGIVVGEEQLTHRVWADNIFVISKSGGEALSMLTELMVAFRTRGFKMKDKSLEWLWAGSETPAGWDEVVARGGADGMDLVVSDGVEN